MYVECDTLISTTYSSMSSAKRARLDDLTGEGEGGGAAAPVRDGATAASAALGPGSGAVGSPAGAGFYTSSGQIIEHLERTLRGNPELETITVFLVSFGKFRIVTRGHAEVWGQLAETARAILSTSALAGRVRVCIEISSALSPPCPQVGSMSFAAPKLAETLAKKENYCSRPIDDLNRMRDIAATLRSTLGEKNLLSHLGNDLYAAVSATPSRAIPVDKWSGLPRDRRPYFIDVKDLAAKPIDAKSGFQFSTLNPQFSSQPCATLRNECEQEGKEDGCLVVFLGGSDRVGGGVPGEDLKDSFMAKSKVPRALLRVGQERGPLGAKNDLLIRLVEWALLRKSFSPPTAAFSSSLVDYVTDMCIWACVPKEYIVRILQKTTIHSPPTIASIINVKENQLKERISNVLELKKHAATLAAQLPDATPAQQRKRTAKAYTTTGAVVQHMSHKMVNDARMLEVLAGSGVRPYSEFQDRVPSEDDFELLMGWKGVASKWWREEPPSKQRGNAVRDVETIRRIRAILEKAEVREVCGWQGLAGGRRTRRKRNTRKKRRHKHAVITRRNRKGSKNMRRLASRRTER